MNATLDLTTRQEAEDLLAGLVGLNDDTISVMEDRLPGLVRSIDDLQPGDWVLCRSRTRGHYFAPCFGMVVMIRPGFKDFYMALPMNQADHHRESRYADLKCLIVKVQPPNPAPALTIPLNLPYDGKSYLCHPDYALEAVKARREQRSHGPTSMRLEMGNGKIELPRDLTMQILFYDQLGNYHNLLKRYPHLMDKGKLTKDEQVWVVLNKLTPSELVTELRRLAPKTSRVLVAQGYTEHEAYRMTKE